MSHVAFNIGDRWKIITRATNKKHAQCSCPKAQRRATKEYYPPHLTGHGSRGVGPLDMVLFGLGLRARTKLSKICRSRFKRFVKIDY